MTSRLVARLALAVSLSGCTLVGLGGGAIYAGSKNSDVRVQSGERPRTSRGASMAIGAGIGLVLDLGFAALALSQSNGPGH